MGHRVSIFLFMDAVYNMLQTQKGELFKVSSVAEELPSLAKMGARIMCCKLCTEIRGLGDSIKPRAYTLTPMLYSASLEDLKWLRSSFLSLARARDFQL